MASFHALTLGRHIILRWAEHLRGLHETAGRICRVASSLPRCYIHSYTNLLQPRYTGRGGGLCRTSGLLLTHSTTGHILLSSNKLTVQTYRTFHHRSFLL